MISERKKAEKDEIVKILINKGAKIFIVHEKLSFMKKIRFCWRIIKDGTL